MIELLWIAIAALGCWNVYAGIKVRVCEERMTRTRIDACEQWELHHATHDPIQKLVQQLYDAIKEETAKRGNLERLLGEHVNGPHPIVLNMEAVYQALCNRAAMERDPDSIIRQSERFDAKDFRDWEGGCGDH